ncbi:hypothetical protein QBC32DRAFT_356425 [Pseudoneurospora amorphoporcata]|uniref:EamA domain-containing protein n=1 Tax=Pseudoneurospora amorphoporcata TaxID=241081 RepID=A0AAN6NJ76_9PEZI|nr:hypothetical protein QBC32DRAFT_356425 [Pseudoneurospora amorphoporcata]
MSHYDEPLDSKRGRFNPYDGDDSSYTMINLPTTSSSSPSSSSSTSSNPPLASRTNKGDDKLHIPDLSALQPSALRSLTTSPFSEHELLSPSFQHLRRTLSRSPSPSSSVQHGPNGTYPPPFPTNIKSGLGAFLRRNRPLFQVAIAQLFGALMNLAARLLELSGEGENEKGGGMHPFQILFARMFLTSLLSLLYMHYTNVPSAPWGRPEVRWLLVLRGVTGFFGIFPLWYSMLYLPLAEATVITFLAPSLSGYLSHLLLRDPFTKKEQIASFVALAGVVLIARPVSFFASPTSPALESAASLASASSNFTSMPQNFTSDLPLDPATDGIPDVSPTERLIGILMALLSVLGASAAYTTIRALGPSTHPLISVNYFSLWCTLVSLTALLLCPLLGVGQEATDLVPAIRWGLPRGWYQWALLVGLGVAGFVMQFLLTSGLGAGPGKGRIEEQSEYRRGRRGTMTRGATISNRATAMIYTQMLFAAGFDRWVFGRTMSGWSVVGCGLIIGSALWAVLGKETDVKKEGAGGGQDGVDLEMVDGALGRPSERGLSDEGEEGVPILRDTELEEDTPRDERQKIGNLSIRS